MQEIDINIEGYNVNGICVGCLNHNRKMSYIDEVKGCFKLLAQIDVPDYLSIQVCWECLAAVRSVMRFRQQIQRAYTILIKYSAKNPFLDSPWDLTQYATTNLTRTQVEVGSDVLDVQDVKEIEIEVKSEPEDNETLLPKQEELKIENEFPDIDDRFSDDFPPDQNATSEDDMQLSKLKEKKVKKEKKAKKRRKKNSDESSEKPKTEQKSYKLLKNLPEDLVTIYTMTEEEMWVMRNQDLKDKEFLRYKHRCEDCLLTFNSEKLMKEHTLAKHRLKSEDCHKCDICKSYFLGKDHLLTHRAQHLTAYWCSACGHATSVRRRARQHAATHQTVTKEKEYECRNCGKTFPRRARQHAATHQTVTKEKEYECRNCGKTFPSRSKLSYHRTKNHKEKLQCDCCGKVFISKMMLRHHLKSQTQSKEEKAKEKLYIPCKGCNKVFHSKKSYRAHVVIHNGLTYPCQICGKLFQWKRNLARHTRAHRERDAGATYECRACGKSFASRDCYNNHMRLSKRHVAEEALAHTCNYCGKKFATKYCMVDHIDWDHLKRIKYQCSVCFKAFKTAKIMVAHMNNIHGGKKSKEPDGQHLCEICGKSYKSVKRLKGHVWAMHTNRSSSKIFKCKLCPATFLWQTSIYKHVKMMHGGAKRAKQTRTMPTKKQEPYPEIELTNRMYFQPNMASGIVPSIGQIQQVPVGIVQNIVV